MKNTHRAHDKRTINQEIGLFRDCQRFRPKERADEQTEEDAMVYISLRKGGQSKRGALNFCLAQHCKIDSTQDIHGPPGFKIFKTKMDKYKMLQGWQLVGKLKYESAHKYEAAKEDLSLAREINKEYNDKLEQLKLYYTTLDEKYSFSNLSKEGLVDKLRSLSTEEQIKSRTPRYQIKTRNDVYYELADYFKSRKQPEPTLITEMEAFEELLPRDKREALSIEPKVIEKPPPFYKETNMERRSKLLKELSLTYRGRMTIEEPQEDLKIAVRKLYKMEFNQGNYISRQNENNPSYTILSSLQDVDDTSTARKRCSILSHRFSKYQPIEEVSRINRFRQRLDDLAQKGLKRMYGESNSPLVGGRKFRF